MEGEGEEEGGGGCGTLEGVEAEAPLRQPAVVVEHGLRAAAGASAKARPRDQTVAVADLCRTQQPPMQAQISTLARMRVRAHECACMRKHVCAHARAVCAKVKSVGGNVGCFRSRASTVCAKKMRGSTRNIPVNEYSVSALTRGGLRTVRGLGGAGCALLAEARLEALNAKVRVCPALL
jgi:hypothetical protein